MKRPERALILLKPQFLGDAVMACPLIDAVAAEYRETIVMCGSMVRQVLADRSSAVRFEHGEKIAGIGPVLRAAKTMRGMRIDHAYVVNRSFRSALAAKMARIPLRIGHMTEGRGFLLTHAAPYDTKRFEADCYLDLAKALSVPPVVAKPRLKIEAHEQQTGRDLLRGASVGIQPGARYADKQVPLEVMAEVARSLRQEGRTIALLGGPDEKEFSRKFQSLVPTGTLDLVGKCGIRDTLGVLASLDLMVGSDTGLMHLAAAVGTATVTVFGPNPASKWGHRYPPHVVLEAPGGRMAEVEPRMIAEAAHAVLGRQNPAGTI